MSEDPNEIAAYSGISLEDWERAFAPTIIEFAATRFIYSIEDQGQVRIALGNAGPFTDNTGKRKSPRYTHAVTLPPDLAITFAQSILKHFAQVGSKSQS